MPRQTKTNRKSPGQTRTPDYVGVGFEALDAKVYADLVASEQRYRQLVELSTDIIVLAELNGRISYVTPSVERTLGYSPEKIVGTDMYDYVHIADRARIEGAFTRIISNLEPVREMFRIRKSNGEYMWVESMGQLDYDDGGNVIGVYAILRDVDEQYRLMEELRHTIIKFRMFHLAVQSSSNHIVITDPDGKIVFANAAAERMTGYGKTEMLGKTPAIWGKQMPPRFYKIFWKTIKQERKAFHSKIVNRRKNGELYTAAMTVSPIISGGSKLIGYVGVEEDITEYADPGSVLSAAEAGSKKV